MFKLISGLFILSSFTSCMQVNLKDDLDFDALDVSSSDEPTGTSGYLETQFIGSRSMSVRYGDYKFMTNSLLDKFGPSCSAIIKTNIWNQFKIFGAVCDYYDTTESCNTSTQNTALATPSTMRSGRVMKTCEEIVANNNCIDYFLGGAGLEVTSTLSNQNILKTYQSFYPLSEEIDEQQQNAFLNLVEKFSGQEDKWRAVSLALCISPEWQIP